MADGGRVGGGGVGEGVGADQGAAMTEELSTQDEK